MRSIALAAGVLLALGGLRAQDSSAKKAKEECAQLTAEFKAASKEFSQRSKEMQATEEFKKAREARDNAALRKLMETVKPVDIAGFTKRFQSAAEKYAGNEDATQFLTWIAQHASDKSAAQAAVATMVDKHVGSPALLGFLENAGMFVRHYDRADAHAILQKVVDGSKVAEVQAYAVYQQAMLIRRDRNATAEDKANADKLVAEAAQLGRGTALDELFNAPKFASEKLQVGMEVPDIVGEDLDGVPFKLSDYRGKVVVLDFWGDW